MKKFFAFIVILCIFSLNLYSQDFLNVGVFGSTGADYIHGYTVDNNGDLIICGTFQNTVDFNMAQDEEATLTSISNYDIYIAKYDMQGAFKWVINLSGDPYEEYYVKNINSDNDGNIYITGYTDSWIDLDPSNEEVIVNQNEDDVFIIAKYSPNGEYIWGYAMGHDIENGQIQGWDVAIDMQSENLFVCGILSDTVDFDPSENIYNLMPAWYFNMFLAKYTTDGALVWAKMFGYPNEASAARPNRLQIDEDDNVYMGGYFEGMYDMDPSSESFIISPAGNSDGFLSKYDQNGNFVWAFSIGSTKSDYFRSMKYLNNKLYTVGSWSDTVDFDPAENSSYELISIPGWETSGFMSVYDKDGSFQSAIGIKDKMMEFGGSGSEIKHIDLDLENNIYVIGNFYGTADFDPSDEVAEISSTGGISDRDMFLAKYDLNNNYEWAINVGGLSAEWGFYVKANESDNIIAFGNYDGDCDFDPSEEEHWINNKGSHDVYMAWYSQFSGSFIANSGSVVETNISPNPLTTSTNLSYTLKQPSSVQLSVFNQLGQLVYQYSEDQQQGEQQLQWDAQGLAEGIYYYRLKAGDQVANGKMVKAR